MRGIGALFSEAKSPRPPGYNPLVPGAFEALNGYRGTEVQIRAHEAMARALHCDPGEHWVLAPFAALQWDESWWIAACDSMDGDGDVLLIDGKTGAMRWPDDARAVGFWGDQCAPGKINVYANGLNFARAWTSFRRATLERFRQVGSVHVSDDALFRAYMPGLAMIGTPDSIGNYAAVISAASIEIDTPSLRQPLADALLRSARLPVVAVPRMTVAA